MFRWFGFVSFREACFRDWLDLVSFLYSFVELSLICVTVYGRHCFVSYVPFRYAFFSFVEVCFRLSFGIVSGQICSLPRSRILWALFLLLPSHYCPFLPCHRRDELVAGLRKFDAAPFTLQRLAEVLQVRLGS